MKKTFTRFIAFLLLFGFTFQLPFQTVAISGADFSTNILAARLQKIFEGHVGMYADSACTKEVVLPLGSRYDKDTKWLAMLYLRKCCI